MTREAAHCTFCDLIHGAAEVSICHEDADSIAFMDIQPVNNGHILVVPREHHESLLDVPQELGIHLFKVTMRLANAIRRVTGCEDLNIIVNSGAAAGQDEPHYHVHIIPRRAGDGFDVPLPFNGSQMPDRTVLDAYAARIISALRDPARIESDKTSASDASTDATQPRAQVRRADAERVVPVPRFAEDGGTRERTGTSARKRAPDMELGASRVGWSAEEGAHGELRSRADAEGSDAQ